METFIFDLDGTLLDTLDDLAASVNHALAAFRLPPQSHEAVRQFLGNGFLALISKSVPPGTPDDLRDQVLAEFRRYYQAHSLDSTRPYPGITPMLQALRQHGVSTAIVSNKGDAVVQELFHRFFADLIDIAIGEQQPQIRRKPCPDMVIEAMRRLHTDAAHTIYVGDSEVDIATARNAGIPCLSVCWGFRPRQLLLDSGATHLIDSPDELLRIRSGNL